MNLQNICLVEWQAIPIHSFAQAVNGFRTSESGAPADVDPPPLAAAVGSMGGGGGLVVVEVVPEDLIRLRQRVKGGGKATDQSFFGTIFRSGAGGHRSPKHRLSQTKPLVLGVGFRDNTGNAFMG